MAQRAIDHFYRTYEEAVQVVADLTSMGVPAANISLIESESDPRLPSEVAEDAAQNPAGTGATMGAVVGGGIGVLDGVGAITIPYTEGLVQTGWVLPMLAFAGVGAIIGAVLGAVTRVGVTNRKAHVLASGLQRGQYLVVVQVDEAYAAQVEAVLNQPRTVSPGAAPVYDMEPVYDPRTPAQEAADIHREEREIQYKSE
jgi:hypothetical protein